MYFTETPSLNSVEAIMKRPPGERHRDTLQARRDRRTRIYVSRTPVGARFLFA